MADYRELGFDEFLFRGAILDLTTDANQFGGESIYLPNKTAQPLSPKELDSGEYNEILTLGRNGYIIAGANGYNDGVGFFLGYDVDTYKFFIGSSTGDNLLWDGTTLSVTGTITVIAGSIAGLTISATALSASAGGNTTIVSSGATAFTAGPTGSPTFTVTQAGVMTATSALIAGWTINATSITSGSVTLNSANEQILLGSATAPLTGEGIFIGKSGSTYHLRAGNPNGDMFYWNPDDNEGIAVAQITHRMTRTAGWDLVEGDVVAVESDGKMYPTRVLDIETPAVGSDTLSPGMNTPFAVRIVRITSQILFAMYKDTTGRIHRVRIVLNDAFTDISTTSDATVTAALETNPHVVDMTTASAMGCYELASTTTVSATMFTGLDTGVTTNTVYSIDTDATTPFLAKVSATQSLMVYKEVTTDDIKVRALSLSGTVISAGSETNVYTGTAIVVDFVRFGESEFYCVIFTEGGSHKAICLQWDGATFTAGASAVTLESTAGSPRVCSVDSTRVAVTGLDGSSNVTTQIVSRSTTVLTAQTALDFDSTTDSPSGSGTVLAPLGADSYVTFYATSATTAEVQLIRVDDNTVTELGTVRSTTGAVNTNNNSSTNMAVVKVAPNLFMTSVNSATTTFTFQLWNLSNNYNEATGASTETIATDATSKIVMSDYSDNFTGLTTAASYYIDVDGALTTEDYAGTSPKFAVALSTTEADIKI